MWKKKTNWKAKTVTIRSFQRRLLARSFLFSFLLCPSPVTLHASLAPHLAPTVIAAPASRKLKPTDPYALIFGTVWGPDNRPVYGVRVNLALMSVGGYD